MAAPTKGSRWGSFLSQAVAGVEARLDNILAEEDPASKQSIAPSASDTPTPTSAIASPPKPLSTPTKSANDRLQERLARAVAAKNAAGTASPKLDASPARRSTEVSSANQSPRPSSDLSRVTSPGPLVASSPRTSLSKDEGVVHTDQLAKTEDDPTDRLSALTEKKADSSLESNQPEQAPPEGLPNVATPTPVTTTSANKEETVQVSVSTSERIVSSLDLYEKRVADLERTLQETQSQHQEELHSQVEQVDALQAKLQYLAREASEAARKDGSAAAPGSLEKKLAEKNEQVAQLMEEGNKLAGNEQKLRAVIKKLRAQITAEEKALNEQKMWRQKAEAELLNLRDAVRRIDEYKKAKDESQKTVAQLRRDLDRVRTTVSLRDTTISDLKAQLDEESERAKDMATKINDQAREDHQGKVKELEDTIASMQIEKSLATDKAKATANDLRDNAERAAERARAVELELKGEVQILESKLEALRATAEEASTGAVGDAQAKLLRQIETLQTQYSIASENWQGIEASLLARTANLEKERDEALRRESDIRKKARESVSHSEPCKSSRRLLKLRYVRLSVQNARKKSWKKQRRSFPTCNETSPITKPSSKHCRSVQKKRNGRSQTQRPRLKNSDLQQDRTLWTGQELSAGPGSMKLPFRPADQLPLCCLHRSERIAATSSDCRTYPPSSGKHRRHPAMAATSARARGWRRRDGPPSSHARRCSRCRRRSLVVHRRPS